MGVFGSPEFLDFIKDKPKECSKCGTAVSTPFCPNCGTPMTETHRSSKWIIFYISAGILIVFLLGFLSKNGTVSKLFSIFLASEIYSLAVLVFCVAAFIIKLIKKQKLSWLRPLFITNISVGLISFIGMLLTSL